MSLPATFTLPLSASDFGGGSFRSFTPLGRQGGFPKVPQKSNAQECRMTPQRPRSCSRCCFSPGNAAVVLLLATFGGRGLNGLPAPVLLA